MATAVLNALINDISGRIGSVVFYRRYGKACARLYVVPRNPDTPEQRKLRRTFADAVKAWQSLTQNEKYKFERKARNMQMSAYNLFISCYMKKESKVAVKLSTPFLYTYAKKHNMLPLHSVSYSIPNDPLYETAITRKIFYSNTG